MRKENKSKKEMEKIENNTWAMVLWGPINSASTRAAQSSSALALAAGGAHASSTSLYAADSWGHLVRSISQLSASSKLNSAISLGLPPPNSASHADQNGLPRMLPQMFNLSKG